MVDEGRRDYFGADVDDDLDDDDLLRAPIVVPVEPASPSMVPAVVAEEPATTGPPTAQGTTVPEVVTPPPITTPVVVQPAVATPPQTPHVELDERTREQRLADALDALMGGNPEIQASALVSLDGFTMASALPPDMQEDRVGAMSAAILGLGERAATELGRGVLDQVFIEGSDGIVVLISAGGRAVLTALAGPKARLGLVLYDMRSVADEIATVLG